MKNCAGVNGGAEKGSTLTVSWEKVRMTLFSLKGKNHQSLLFKNKRQHLLLYSF